MARRELRLGLHSANLQSVTLCLVTTGIVFAVTTQHLSIGQYAAYVSAFAQFQQSLFLVFWNTAVTDKALLYIRDLMDYMDLERGRSLSLGPVTPAVTKTQGRPSAPTIVFQHVSFGYPGSPAPALHDISFVIHSGERIALVGENGAGKSTVAKLLLGLYVPATGRIIVDGTDLQSIDPREWRSRVSAVFQDYMRYELTARENIGFGDLSRLMDDQAVAVAAQKSGAAAVVAGLPAGYETNLGRAYDENGLDLSVGQWQKLAVARCYMRDAQVLVLDEPTSALDPRAEVEVYKSFRDMSRSRSVLLISHRMGSARLANRIVVVHRGRIVQEGTHVELMRNGGRYADMLAAQAHWYA